MRTDSLYIVVRFSKRLRGEDGTEGVVVSGRGSWVINTKSDVTLGVVTATPPQPLKAQISASSVTIHLTSAGFWNMNEIHE